MNYVYLLKSLKDNWTYVGSTQDLQKRFRQHNNGEVKATNFYKPLNLVYYEAYRDLETAINREKEIKVSATEKDRILKRIGLRK